MNDVKKTYWKDFNRIDEEKLIQHGFDYYLLPEKEKARLLAVSLNELKEQSGNKELELMVENAVCWLWSVFCFRYTKFWSIVIR